MRAREILWLLAAVAVAAYVVTWSDFAGRVPLHGYTIRDLFLFGEGESALYLELLVVQPVVVLAAMFTFGRPGLGATARFARLGNKLAEAPRRSLAAIAFCAAAAAFVLSVLVVQERTLLDDEKTYLFQAKLLLDGQLSVSVPPEASALWQPYLAGKPGEWSGQYPWAQPALLAMGLRFASPWAIAPLELLVTVYFGGLLAWQVTGNSRVGLGSAALAALSPTLLLGAASLHTSNLSAACCTVLLWSFARLHQGRSRAAAVALGLSASVAAHARPLDALVFSTVAFALFACVNRRRFREIYPDLALAGFVALPGIALLPVTNYLTSGSALHNGYWLFAHSQAHEWLTMGFGKGPMGIDHSFPKAVAKMFPTLVRLAFYLLGTPCTLAVLALPAVGLLPMPRATFSAPMVLLAVYLFAYFLFAGGTTIFTMGPVYYEPIVPVVAGCVVAIAFAAHDRFGAVLATRLDIGGLFVGGALAAALFLAPQLGELGRAARAGDRCAEAARRHGIDRGLVFVGGRTTGCYRSWQCWPPMPDPRFEDALLFPRAGTAEEDQRVAKAFGADRPVYFTRCMDDPAPGTDDILPYDPAARLVAGKPLMDEPSHRAARRYPRATMAPLPNVPAMPDTEAPEVP